MIPHLCSALNLWGNPRCATPIAIARNNLQAVAPTRMYLRDLHQLAQKKNCAEFKIAQSPLRLSELQELHVLAGKKLFIFAGPQRWP